MTTKTQAAKAFAEKYGIYSPNQQTYTRADVPSAGPTYTELRLARAEATEQRARAERAIADLKAVMRLLGADKEYEDDTQVYQDYSYVTFSTDRPITRTRVTKTALQKFREDIRTVDKANDAAAALDRLAGGTK